MTETGAPAYVNVYALGRDYGGPEEGGWYFDIGSVELSIETTEEYAGAIAGMLREVYRDNSSRYSVIHYRLPQDYGVWIEDAPAADFPEHTPHYE